MPVAKYVKERGFDTYGYDISPKAVEMAQKTGAIEKVVNFREFDVFILRVLLYTRLYVFTSNRWFIIYS